MANYQSSYSRKRLRPAGNPTSDFLVIESSKLYITLNICNIMGKMVIFKIIDKNSIEISVKELASGIYFIKIENSKVYKFIKQ